MSFERIRDDLQTLEARLSKGQQITALDVFNTIRDLCEDIRSDTGAAVEQHPAGDTSALLRQLPWMGRLVSRQYRQIEGQVTDTGRQEQMDGKMRELEDLTEKLEVLCGETSALEQRQKQLLSLREQLQSQSEKKQQLHDACRTLDDQNRQMASVTVPQLQEEQLGLQLENDRMNAQVLRLRQQLDQDRQLKKSLQEQLENLRADISACAGQCESCQEGSRKLQQEKEQMERLLELGQQQLKQLREQAEDAHGAWMVCSERQLPQAQELLESLQSARDEQLMRIQQTRREAAALQKQTEELMAQQEQLREQTAMLDGQVEALRTDRQEKAEQLARLKQLQGELDSECASLRQQLEQLDTELGDRDCEQMKQTLSEAIESRRKALSECQELELRIQDQAQKNRETQTRNQELTSQRDRLLTEESALKSQTEQMEGWLQGLELEQYMQRLERMRQRNQELYAAQLALQEELQRLMAAGNITAAQLDPGFFQADFRNMEAWILHYQRLFADTVHKLSSNE